MKSLHLCCFCVAASLIANIQGQTFSADFNTVNQFTDNFNVYQNAATPVVSFTGSPYTQGAASGVGGGGGIDVTIGNATNGITSDSTAIFKNTTFNFANSGSSLTVSAMMKVTTPGETGNRLLQLGFVNDATSGMNGNPGLAFMSLRFNPTATTSTTFTPQWQTKTAAAGVANTTVAPNITFVNNDWYLMSLTFVNNGGGSISGSGFVQDFGPNGDVAGATTAITGQTLTSTDIAADSSVFAAFRGFRNDGLVNLDNFAGTVNVPEPTTIALGLSGAALIFGRRRRC